MPCTRPGWICTHTAGMCLAQAAARAPWLLVSNRSSSAERIRSMIARGRATCKDIDRTCATAET